MPKVSSSSTTRQIKRQARRAVSSSDPLPPFHGGSTKEGTQRRAVGRRNDGEHGHDRYDRVDKATTTLVAGLDASSAGGNNDNNTSTTLGGGGHQLSRGQKKRQAKREKYIRREKMILSSLKLAKQEEQKGKIDGLESLREALIETTTATTCQQREQQQQSSTNTPSQQGAVTNTNKSKRRLVADEVEHLDLVLRHPRFAANPFETISEHLQNSLADERKKQEIQSKERSDSERRHNEEKIQLKKERLDGLFKKKSKKKKYKPRRTN